MATPKLDKTVRGILATAEGGRHHRAMCRVQVIANWDRIENPHGISKKDVFIRLCDEGRVKTKYSNFMRLVAEHRSNLAKEEAKRLASAPKPVKLASPGVALDASPRAPESPASSGAVRGKVPEWMIPSKGDGLMHYDPNLGRIPREKMRPPRPAKDDQEA